MRARAACAASTTHSVDGARPIVKIVIFGLTISSSWGNGHATEWRGLTRALIARGVEVVFFERDAPYFASHRDCDQIPGGQLHIYSDWDSVRAVAVRHLAEADVGVVTSYCPDALLAGDAVISAARPLAVFY